jgi:hypothetical protein
MPHIVKPYIDGDWIGVKFECTEPEGSLCRMRCPVDPKDPYRCEEIHAEPIDGEWWHVGYHYDEETDEETEGPLHKMVPGPGCGIIEWDALNECFAGEGEQPLREGEIVFTWTGDNYEWTYKEEGS